jgi:hypothetical protein
MEFSSKHRQSNRSREIPATLAEGIRQAVRICRHGLPYTLPIVIYTRVIWLRRNVRKVKKLLNARTLDGRRAKSQVKISLRYALRPFALRLFEAYLKLKLSVNSLSNSY